jgi:hypothetical protein
MEKEIFGLLKEAKEDALRFEGALSLLKSSFQKTIESAQRLKEGLEKMKENEPSLEHIEHILKEGRWEIFFTTIPADISEASLEIHWIIKELSKELSKIKE